FRYGGRFLTRTGLQILWLEQKSPKDTRLVSGYIFFFHFTKHRKQPSMVKHTFSYIHRFYLYSIIGVSESGDVIMERRAYFSCYF
ncbi:unnamed protein product, partial [Arabidopsis halleri]